MKTYNVTTPARPGVLLRLIAYLPAYRHPHPDLKVVLQATDSKGNPIAEDPLSCEFLAPDEFEKWLDTQRSEGWAIEPANAKYVRPWRAAA